MKKISLEKMEKLEGSGEGICNGFASGLLAGLGIGFTLSGAGAGVGLLLAASSVGLDYYCEGQGAVA